MSALRSGVNATLTANTKVEHGEYAAMLRRMGDAYARRVGETGDPYDLGDMLGIVEHFDHAVTDAVRGLHDRGYSWAEIGEGAGITRQAAQQRWGGAHA